MKALALATVVALAFAFLFVSSAAAASTATSRQVEKATTSLLWLGHHPRAGSRRSRARASAAATRLLFGALRASGFYPAALCVHRYEGSWWDAGEPYFGGMQEDVAFQATYGPEFLARWGTANGWPPWAQLVAAYRAWGPGGRGWSPWPNTARVCGLL